jgi:uncharacterized protein (TIGR00369 family)
MAEEDRILAIIREIYEQLPFNRHLGLRVNHLGPEGAGFDFAMRPELIGNYVYGILHGGAISSVLDATGGLVATASAAHRLRALSDEEIKKSVARVGTIDMRIDFLRPGKGNQFYSSGSVMRTGRKVSVTRMELRNEADILIAVGTAAYIL